MKAPDICIPLHEMLAVVPGAKRFLNEYESASMVTLQELQDAIAGQDRCGAGAQRFEELQGELDAGSSFGGCQ